MDVKAVRSSRRRAGATLMLAAVAVIALSAPGAAQAKTSTRIVGGSVAANSDWPWAAFIVFGGNTACAGTLIAPGWVLTAAHCVLLNSSTGGSGPTWPPGLVQVTLGHHHLTHTAADNPVVASQVVVDPSYDDNTGRNDVGLIQLSTPSQLSPLHIAAPSETALWTPGAATGTIVGWGTTSESGSPSDDLMQASLPILSDAQCAATVGTYDPATMLCAGLLGSGGVDACQGDSGGPLMVPNGPGLWRLAGSVSFGVGCGRPFDPGVYTRAGAGPLHDWIFATVPGLEYPVASFAVSPTRPVVGQPVTLASTSTDTAGLPLTSVSWDLGPGQPASATTAAVTTRFSTLGPVNVHLHVTDSAGVTDDAIRTLQVVSATPPPVKRSTKHVRCVTRRRRVHGKIRRVRVCTTVRSKSAGARR
jgi:trypsin